MTSPNGYFGYGAWVTAIYKVIKDYNLNDPIFDPYEQLIAAGKVGMLLSPIRSLGYVPSDKFEIYRTYSGIRPRESTGILDQLARLGALELDRSSEVKLAVAGVTPLATTNAQVLEMVGEFFSESHPTDVEWASIAVMQETVTLPQTKDFIQSRLAVMGYPEEAIEKAIGNLVSFQMLASTHETDGGSHLLFNPIAFQKNASDVFSSINALGSSQKQQAMEVLEHVRRNPGVPIPPGYDKDLVALLIKCGLIDMSAINARNGTVTVEFPTAPYVWSVENKTGDVVDDAKVLLNSLRYGQFYSSPGRGQIDDPYILVDRLITRSSVGPATAIGQDYPLPLARGIVSIAESRIHPGRYYMELRKPDVATAVRDVIAHNAIAPAMVDDEIVVKRHLGERGNFSSPDLIRALKPLPPSLVEQRDSLAFQLRTYRKGR